MTPFVTSWWEVRRYVHAAMKQLREGGMPTRTPLADKNRGRVVEGAAGVWCWEVISARGSHLFANSVRSRFPERIIAAAMRDGALNRPQLAPVEECLTKYWSLLLMLEHWTLTGPSRHFTASYRLRSNGRLMFQVTLTSLDLSATVSTGAFLDVNGVCDADFWLDEGVHRRFVKRVLDACVKLATTGEGK